MQSRSQNETETSPRRPRMCWRLAGVTVALLVAVLVSCQPQPEGPSIGRGPAPARIDELDVRLPRTAAIQAEPMVRVRVVRTASQVQLQNKNALRITAYGQNAQPMTLTGPVTITRKNGQFVFQNAQGALSWQLPAVRVEPTSAATIAVDGKHYPGDLVLVAVQNTARKIFDRFDVVNHVPLETYLPGVLEKELYPNWEASTFEAQAIAARSYALFEQALHDDRHYDMESTTASQVYGGAAKNPRAIAAVQRTRGQVVAYNGVVVPTFFSSCTGGTAQDATAAFPYLGDAMDMAPLRGGTRGNWDSGSRYFRWGPITRDANTLAKRMAAWGTIKKQPIADIQGIGDIQVTRYSSGGRPAEFAITDARGRVFTLPAEWFRFACNTNASGLAKLSNEQILRSSHVRVQVTGHQVQFTAGQGFGHGVGLSQWGAQGMALAGYDGHSILRFYYPASQIQRLY